MARERTTQSSAVVELVRLCVVVAFTASTVVECFWAIRQSVSPRDTRWVRLAPFASSDSR